MKTLIMNSTHLVGTDNNVLTYNFPTGSVQFKDNKVGLGRLSMYYSWENVSSANNAWSYTWIDGTVVSVSLPAGFYTVSDMNAYLQSIMISNGHYLKNASSENVFYIELVTNAVYYTVQLNCYAVPTSLSTGWTNPGSWSLPVTAKTPQATISSLSSLIGIPAGTYPSTIQSTNFSTQSTSTPQITPVQSVLITCSLINNPLSNPTTLLYSFSPNVTYGSLLSIEPAKSALNDIKDGAYNQVTLRFYDQTFSPLKIKDPNIVLLLEIA